MMLMNRFKLFFDRLDVTKKGYVVNKWLTNGAFLLLLVYMCLIVFVTDGPSVLLGGFYAECPLDGDKCVNPFYDSSCVLSGEFCEDAFVYPGWVYGVKPSVFAKSFPLVAFLVIAGALGLNHFIYNEGWRHVS